MNPSPNAAAPENTLKAMQLLTVVLTASPMTFGVIAVFLSLGEEPQLDRQWAYMMLAGLAVGLVLWVTVPGLVAQAGRRQLRQLEGTPQEVEQQRRGHLFQLYQKRHIIALALLEGVAMASIVCFMLTTELWLLALSSLPIAMMAASFPWKERVELWVQEQSHLLDMGR